MMKTKMLKLLVAGAIVGCASGTRAARADTVTEWNAIMQATVTTPPTNPFFQARGRDRATRRLRGGQRHHRATTNRTWGPSPRRPGPRPTPRPSPPPIAPW